MPQSDTDDAHPPGDRPPTYTEGGCACQAHGINVLPYFLLFDRLDDQFLQQVSRSVVVVVLFLENRLFHYQKGHAVVFGTKRN